MTPSSAIAALRSSGMTELEIARSVGLAQSSVNRIGRGSMEPAYSKGKVLVDMARSRIKKQR